MKHVSRLHLIAAAVAGSLASLLPRSAEAQLSPAAAAVVPIGSIIPYAGTPASLAKIESAGFLLCDGRQIPSSTYKELAEVLGAGWQNAEGAVSFRLPDLRGLFIRGVDFSPNVTNASTGNDPDKGRQVGTLQEDALMDHIHTIEARTASALGNERGVLNAGGAPVGTIRTAPPTVDTAERGSQVYASRRETRPKNVSVWYIIRAR